jgi:hypothetical protein
MLLPFPGSLFELSPLAIIEIALWISFFFSYEAEEPTFALFRRLAVDQVGLRVLAEAPFLAPAHTR